MKRALLSSIAFLLAACASATPIPDQPFTSPSQTPNLPLVTSTISIADIQQFTISIAHIQISLPGRGSQLTSPLEFEAYLYPGAAGKVRVELFTSDGNLLARKILRLAVATDQATQLQTSIDFEVRRASDATLVISTEDEYGRVQALNSVDVILLPEGEQLITPAGDFVDAIQISLPRQGDKIADGSLIITGQANSQPGRPLNIQLINREGRVLSFGEVYPRFEQDSEWGTFEIKLSYQVKEETWVKIAITENDPQIPRPIHFNGVEVLLTP